MYRNQAVPSLKHDRPRDVSVRPSLLPTSASVSVHWWCPVLVLSCWINKTPSGFGTSQISLVSCLVWRPRSPRRK
ncbi:hypothetical protein AGOR_G00137710 [Albula goreensis]|uniref:Uncharacterized protein n=1 Tax=Albula goreensis TaxID=1534307 RepID=A0A8T3DAQ7_9TELE|nr:hypothetical protein AGOR_G00137710 [Albula goreensis]